MNTWQVEETTFDAEQLHHQETIFTLGNGYLGTRGAFEEGYPGDHALTLVHGIFDDVPIVHTELVNVPNWLDFTVWMDGERFSMDRGEILDYHRALDLRTGTLTRSVRWRSPQGHTLALSFERFASLADGHVLGLRCRITSLDFTGALELRAGLPGYVDNDGMLHWEWGNQGALDAQGAYLTVRTKTTHLVLSEACHLAVQAAAPVTYSLMDCHWSPTVTARVALSSSQTVTAEKLVAIFTSRDVGDPEDASVHKARELAAQGYTALRAASDAVWATAWDASDVLIEGDPEANLAVRFSMFQLLIAAPWWEDRVSIPAKSLSGLGYRGHVFWDTEIFMLPFFIYTQPALARKMLLYRYHTLPGARRKAQAGGFEGAMYAWESAATGDETTPRWVPVWAPGIGTTRDLVRIWCGDIEVHISADVAYAVYQYWRITGDDAFMRDYGAEIVFETSRFWASYVTWSDEEGRYEIRDVIGPDENHEHVDNNAYTNRLARWNLEIALEVLAWLQETAPEQAAHLTQKLDVSATALAHWQDVIAKLYLPFDSESGLIEQFSGFFDLETVDFSEYAPRATSMQALLGIEETQQYQILKQPDVLMLLYLLADAYPPEVIRANWDYYTPRTDLSYGSSLGPAIQAALAARLGDVEAAYQHFLLAARTDLDNARGNAADGIHAATAGGLWQAVILGFGGVHVGAGQLVAHPQLPPTWTRLKFRLQYQGRVQTFDLRQGMGQNPLGPVS